MTLFINMISGRVKVLLFDNHNSRIKHFSFVCKDLLFVRHVSTEAIALVMLAYSVSK